MPFIENFHNEIQSKKLFVLFTWGTRILLALAFIPSGLKKVLGERFTILDIETSVGFFFEALYRTGWYYNFLGFMQLLVAVLILIPRATTLGALLYLPIIINIFIIVVAMHFTGTPYIVGLMLIANLYLLFWDYNKIKKIVFILFEK
ncbi:DoxX family membrane protein [Flavobacteriaceae bacterium PRS1]|nr:DoxX family membrane protein [Flavobacteriaceae bacterium PRS1]